jgi:flagellar protein FliT
MTATGSDVLALYGDILSRSREMLALAQSQEWDALVDNELLRRDIVARLRQTLEAHPDLLQGPEKARSEALIREILDLDNQTRTMAQQWMEEIEHRLSSVTTTRRLKNTYLGP